MWICHSTCVEVQGQLERIGSLLSQCGSLGSNSGQWLWQQTLSYLPSPNYLFLIYPNYFFNLKVIFLCMWWDYTLEVRRQLTGVSFSFHCDPIDP